MIDVGSYVPEDVVRISGSDTDLSMQTVATCALAILAALLVLKVRESGLDISQASFRDKLFPTTRSRVMENLAVRTRLQCGSR